MMTELAEPRIRQLLQSIAGQRIGLIGDLFLDRYFHIDPELDEPSIETGLTAYQVTQVRNHPGALGTVMANLAALGVKQLVPITVIGDDGLGCDLRRAMHDLPLVDDGIVKDAARMTPTYLKPLRVEPGGRLRELNRLDVRTRAPLSDRVLREVVDRIDTLWESVDGWIVLDQVGEPDMGVVHHRVRSVIEAACRRDAERVVVVDSREQIGRFGCGILKGNEREFCRTASVGEERVAEAAIAAARRTGRTAFCTRGETGILVAEPDGRTEHVPGIPVEGPIDIVGAGDSVTAAVTTSLLAGASWREAAAFGNLVASITIRQIGTTGTASPEALIAAAGA